MNPPFNTDLLSGLFDNIDRGVVWWVFVGACVLYAIFTFILLFHWERYGMNNPKIILAEIIYLIVSVQAVSLAYSSVTAFINHV